LPWKVASTQLLLPPNGGGAELTVRLTLAEAWAAPYRDAGQQQFQQLHEGMKAACLALAEAVHVRDAVRGLQNDQEALEKVRTDLAALDNHLMNGDDLRGLGRQREDLKNQAALLTERLTRRRQELPAKIEAFRRAAERRAQSLRVEALAQAERLEQALGGCLGNVGNELARLIAVGVFQGIAKGVQDQYLASELAEKLAPPLPAPAGAAAVANPFLPRWQQAPMETGSLPLVAPRERRRPPPPDAVKLPPPEIVVGAIPVTLSEKDKQVQEALRQQTIALVQKEQDAAAEFCRRAAEVAAARREREQRS
jgi:hypothetical protein